MATPRDEVPYEIVREFDHLVDTAQVDDPFQAFEQLRGPRVAWSPAYGGFWVPTTAEDIRRVARDEAFTNTIQGIPPIEFWPRRLVPAQVDPPEHTKYRQLLSPLFSPGAVEQWADATRQTCRDLIDNFIDDGRCDFIWQFARIVPLRVFVIFMGLDEEDAERWTRWHWDVVRAEGEAKDRLGAQIGDLLQELVAERANSPDAGDDVLDICYNLFVASLDTTASMLAFSLYFLAGHDEHRRRLSSDLSLVPVALEELLRYHSFVTTSRRARRDVELGGTLIRQGDQVLVPFTLGSRDPAETECPHEFRIDRFPNRHLAFGAGPHRCLGSHLARMELQVALEEWHRRIPEYRLPEGFQVVRKSGMILRIDELELEWDVAPPHGARAPGAHASLA